MKENKTNRSIGKSEIEQKPNGIKRKQDRNRDMFIEFECDVFVFLVVSFVHCIFK